MKLYTFIGAPNVGKSHIALATAKILIQMGKKVLLVDSTNTSGIISMFHFSDEEKPNNNNTFSFEREDIDILVVPYSGGQDNELTKEIKKAKDYDYVLLECDSYHSLVEDSERIFFTCNCDRKTFKDMKALYNKVVKKQKVTLVFNNLLVGKNFRDYIYNLLLSDLTLSFTPVDEDIEIPFMEKDLILSCAGKLSGNFKINPYSSDFKDAIFKIINLISELESKEYKRILKRRSV